MSVTPRKKLLCAASAVSLSAMGFLIGAAPVGASPIRPLDPAVPCDSVTFPANLNIHQSDGTLVVVNNAAGAQLGGAEATYTVGGKTTTGSANGGATGGYNVDFTITWNSGPGNGGNNHYTGVVTKAGNAQGDTVGTKGSNVQKVQWSSMPGPTFGCVVNPAPVVNPVPPVVSPGPVAPAGPTISVTPDQKSDGSALNFLVTNTSTPAQDLQCTYAATKVSGNNWSGGAKQSFALKAGASFTVKNAGLPLIFNVKTIYDVDISCQGQNGGAAYSHRFSS